MHNSRMDFGFQFHHLIHVYFCQIENFIYGSHFLSANFTFCFFSKIKFCILAIRVHIRYWKPPNPSFSITSKTFANNKCLFCLKYHVLYSLLSKDYDVVMNCVLFYYMESNKPSKAIF